jgi:UDPglucose 6-dehydrogenase
MMPFMEMCGSAYDLVQAADAVIVMTPWNEFMQLDMQRIKDSMRTPVMIDGRNLYDPAEMQAIGFAYRGVGRGYNSKAVK